ncbi:hypothetical protein RAN3_2505 [plant metagenome]|uniref:Uncharacterized protein n=1 Tax=plant metagenome TaxID=1297885 RepID=A0A484U2B8_9ZZZZ
MPVVYDAGREQVNSAAAYGEVSGLNIQQHVWLSIFSAAMADPNLNENQAAAFADRGLPLALARLEELA